MEVVSNPLIVIIGWLVSFVLLGLLINRKSDLSNQELSNLAGLGAFIFVIQSFFVIPIPFSVFPIFYTLSGITLVVTIAGPTRGILVGAIAMTLNHLYLPGSLSMLGTNLSNMIITALLIGWLPSQIYHNPYSGRRIRYIGTFLGGFLYVIIEGLLIYIEIGFFYTTRSDIVGITLGFLLFIVLLGIIEGVFTAIAASYYHRTFLLKNVLDLDLELNLDKIAETEIEKIDFDFKFIAEMKKKSRKA